MKHYKFNQTAPYFRAGDVLMIKGQYLPDMKKDGNIVHCRVLFPREDGRYLVRILDNNSFALIDEDWIVGDGDVKFDDYTNFDRGVVRLVFFGNGQFALPTLKMLVERGYDVAAVVTMQDKEYGRGRKLRPSAVKEYAESVGIQVFQPKKLNSNRFLRRIHGLHASVGVCAEFRKIPAELISIFHFGIINLHSSLLPSYRGASTIASAIKDGCESTGVTTFYITEKIDTGDIINNYAIAIKESDNAQDVFNRLKTIGAEMIDDALCLTKSLSRSMIGVRQTDLFNVFMQPSYAPKLHKEDCEIDWNKPAEKVYNFIRALSPMPTAWTTVKFIDQKEPIQVKIHKSSKTDIPRDYHAPGELFAQGHCLYISCSDNILRIEELQFPNKRKMTAKEFLNGFRYARKGFCDLKVEYPEETAKEI